MVKTTLEMDGYFTEKDIANKNKVMKQCKACLKYTENDMKKPDVPCTYCEKIDYDQRSTISLRTYTPKRKRTTWRK